MHVIMRTSGSMLILSAGAADCDEITSAEVLVPNTLGILHAQRAYQMANAGLMNIMSQTTLCMPQLKAP